MIYPAIKCVYCKKEFNPRMINQEYCSSQCRKTERIEGQLHRDETIFYIFQRDNFQCQYCGESPRTHNIVLQLDHLFPKGRGGSNNLYNMVTSCRRCNEEKGSWRLSKEFIKEIWDKNDKYANNLDEFKKREMVDILNEMYPEASILIDTNEFGETSTSGLFGKPKQESYD